MILTQLAVVQIKGKKEGLLGEGGKEGNKSSVQSSPQCVL